MQNPPAARLARQSASSFQGLQSWALTCAKDTAASCLAMRKKEEQRRPRSACLPSLQRPVVTLEANRESASMTTSSPGALAIIHTNAHRMAASSMVLLSPMGSPSTAPPEPAAV